MSKNKDPHLPIPCLRSDFMPGEDNDHLDQRLEPRFVILIVRRTWVILRKTIIPVAKLPAALYNSDEIAGRQAVHGVTNLP